MSPDSLTSDQEQSRILINRTYPKFQHILRTDRPLLSIEKWKAEIFDSCKELIICRDQGKVVGTALLTISPKEDLVGISHLTRHQDSQNKGIGLFLLKTAEQRAKEIHSKSQIVLTTVWHPDCPQEGLVNWYLKNGYQFKEETVPNKDLQEDWKEEFRIGVRIKYFSKSL